jgi:hypothetical protein
MSLPSQKLVRLESILDTALSNYKKETGNDLLAHGLAAEFQSCDSVGAILGLIKDQAKVFDNFRDGKVMRWIGSLVKILDKLSAIGKVRIGITICKWSEYIQTGIVA